MAPPANKRRKTEHVSSGDEDDDASFASFGDSDNDNEEQEQDVNGAGIREKSQDVDGELSQEDEDDDEEEEGRDEDTKSGGAMSNGTKTANKPSQRPKANTKPSHASASASAYANGTFKSNMFKLQVDELLEQIRPRQGKREKAAETALHTLKKSIEQIPARGPSTLVEAERELINEKIAIPFSEPRPPKDAKYKFSYARPTNVNVVGSFALKTASRSRDMVEVDMVVTMPGSSLEEKDYLNHRYFYKRAYYLACLAAGLQRAHKTEFSYQWGLFHGNPLQPVLIVGPVHPEKTPMDRAPVSKWRINILPCISQEQFPLAKLRPDRNCVRSKDETQDGDQAPTAFYNSALRSEMLMTPYLKLLHGSTKSCEAYVDTCLLGSAWLRQRGFGASIETGGFGNFEWAALIAVALQGGGPNNKPLLSNGYSSYQLFKATLQLLAMKDFAKHSLVVGNASEAPKPVANPIVWDGDRGHNLLFKVSAWAYALLRYEARSTLAALGDHLHDGFDATFILRVNQPLYRYDYMVSIPRVALSGPSKAAGSQGSLIAKLYDVMKQGLSNRVDMIVFTQPRNSAWALGSSRPNQTGKDEMKIGFVVNPDNVKRTVDHGPSAENKAEAAAFRKFWGEKSELRRFQDGSILESLVWSSPQESGHSVFEQIVRYLLGHHFGLVTTDDLSFHGAGFAKLARGSSERTVFDPLMARYKQFEEDVRGLRDLPLSIRSIMPSDPQLRYTSPIPPMSGNSAYRSDPTNVVLQFEGSARWPDDLVAIQRTKLAFLLKLSEMLQESGDSIITRIGLENEEHETLNQGFLDVSYDTDATFRLRIYHDREQTLHERRLKDKTVDQLSREASVMGLAKYKRDFVKAPAHTQAISRLCVRFPALSGSIRLTKRWFASHLLTSHIADEVIELIVVRTFTQPWPWQVPSSVQTGFLRTLLWISRWDWHVEPLIVDLSASGDLKQADLQAITTNFEAWRKLDPGLNRVVLFTASNIDRDGTTYTDSRPAKVVAGRMSALAKAACVEITEKGMSLEPLSLFSSPLEDFDFAIHLHPSFAGGKTKTTKPTTTFKNLSLSALDDTSLVGFNPIASYLKDLESQYGSAVLFFSGGSERPVIGGLWSPLTARRAWKVNLAYSTIPIKSGTEGEDGAQADINKTAIVAEMARLGGDLVEKVEAFAK